MANNETKPNGEENPADLTGLKLGPLKKAAAGIPAVVSTFNNIF